MKVLCLIDSLGSGGAQRQLVTLAELLHKQGNEVAFLVYYEFDFFKDKLDKLNIPVYKILEHRPLKRIFKIRKHIHNGDYDVVISFLQTPNFLNCIAAIGNKKWRVITSERSAKNTFFKTSKGRIFGWAQRYSDIIVCNSNNSMEQWKHYYPNYSSKLRVIYNPVMLPRITSKYIPKYNGKLQVIIAASYQYLKNPINLIKALSLLNEQERAMIEVNWYGRVEVSIGNSLAFQEATNLIKENNLESVIYLNEETKDIADKMNKADIVGLFSELEGLPNAICEGMMIGKPIIMSRVSDFQVLVDETNGFLCDWNKPESIKEALISAINLDENKLIEMGVNSKRKADLIFAHDPIINSWINIIENK